MTTLEIKQSRKFIALVIRCWRSNLLIAGFIKSDKQLAELIGVTPVSFSRLANGTSTPSLPVYHALMVAISNTLGDDVRYHISKDCHSAVYGD